MQGIKRELGNHVQHKLHITPQILLDMEKVIIKSDCNERIFYAARLVAFFTLFQKANLTAPSESGFDSSIHLSCGDFAFCGSGLMLITSQWSKTNQFRERVLKFPVAPTSGFELNAVLHVQLYFAADPASASNAAFRVKKGRKYVLMTGNWFAKKLAEVLTRAGFPPKDYSGHSFRAGGATWAMECGLSREMIKLLGDWKSDAYLDYLRLSDDVKVVAACTLANTLHYKIG